MDWNVQNYKMNHPQRGYALIFDFDEFEPHLKLNPRSGSSEDAQALKSMAEALRFEVPPIPKNLTKDQLYDEVEKYIGLDYTDHDCVMVFILTHGDGKYLFTKDDKFEFDFIWKSFNANNCPTLADKPKLFFLQACQGKFPQQPAVLGALQHCPLDFTGSYAPQAPYNIPQFADFFLAYSTIPGFCSYRHPTYGSLYIQSLCEGFAQAHQLDIHGIVTYANRQVSDRYGNLYEVVQMPQSRSLLRRNIWFH